MGRRDPGAPLSALAPLPIDAVIPQVVEALRSIPNLVLRAATGAGKTTRVPPALLDAFGGEVWMLEPRRVAARASAARIAEERGVRLGDEVGYQVRHERVGSARTRLWVVTEGLLVRRLQDDPFLDGVTTVILDEFHERSLHADLSLAMLRRIQRDARPDLRIVVMSATLDAGPVADWLEATVIESEGRSFPVTLDYLTHPDPRPIHDAAAAAVHAAMQRGERDVLVFLPGIGEIRRTAERVRVDAEILWLYGDLPPEEQDRVLRPARHRRVILATNVAETSLTLPSVDVVVDLGWARLLEHDASTGLDALVLRRIAKANADQRAGRAGRVAAGTCLRWWTAREHSALPERILPEIRRVDVAGPVLQLLAWGERDVTTFPWFETPDAAALTAARALLADLGAVEAGVTPLGQRISRWPLHPRLGRLLHDCARAGYPALGSLAAAILSERAPADPNATTRRSESDLLDLCDRVRREERNPAFHAIRRLSTQLGELTRDLPRAGATSEAEALGRAVLAAFPDRVARARAGGERRARMVGGRGLRLDDRSAVDAELFVALDADDAARGAHAEALVRRASAVDPTWLPTASVVEAGFDDAHERVAATRRVRYRDLVLAESSAPLPAADAVSAALLVAARARPERVAPEDPEAIAALERLRCAAAWMPDLELPELDIAALLPEMCTGRRSFAELRSACWATVVLEAMPYARRQVLDREVPERVVVPTGNAIRLRYELGRPPVLAVKMQELFGWREVPRLARGTVRVVVHLLAPNGRPQQITDDLASFWNNGWPEIRKELRARYPRHGWPEDPWNAPPQARPTRRS